MLSLRIVRGPLEPHQNEAILAEYNRLTHSRIPMQEFVRWVQEGPEGPAWHALLETEDAEVVGHTSLIPLRARFRTRQMTPAKSEYSVIREEFRAAKLRGFERTVRPKFLILIDELFRHCAAQGWGPFLISTTPALHRLGPRVECYPTDFPLWECLLVLRPRSAAQETPNLTFGQRAALFTAGVAQSAVWSAVTMLGAGKSRALAASPLDAPLDTGDEKLAFFEDGESLRWRYLEGQYARVGCRGGGEDCVIAKRGAADRYLRVCQWQLRGDAPDFALIAKLVRMAREDKALGVRWAIFGDDERTARFAGKMRKFGFLSVRRVRTLLVHANDPGFRTSSVWNLTDSFFSFDP